MGDFHADLLWEDRSKVDPAKILFVEATLTGWYKNVKGKGKTEAKDVLALVFVWHVEHNGLEEAMEWLEQYPGETDDKRFCKNLLVEEIQDYRVLGMAKYKELRGIA